MVPPARSSWRLDTESAARVHHAAFLGTSSSTTPLTTVASTLGRLAPALLVLLKSDAHANELERRLTECAKFAEQQVNQSLFGGRLPTREECGEELSVDGCDEPITRAMLLGRQKHALALACAREVLSQFWPAPFSLEQRYRFYPNVRFLETVSHEEEQRLIEQGCTRQLWRTLKPDIVLHSDSNLLQAVVVIDFKFPCPHTNTPTWRQYGETSAYARMGQGEVYKLALGGEALLISPGGVSP